MIELPLTYAESCEEPHAVSGYNFLKGPDGREYVQFPSLGDGLTCPSADCRDFIAEIKGLRFRIQIDMEDWRAPYRKSKATIRFTPCSDPLPPYVLIPVKHPFPGLEVPVTYDYDSDNPLRLFGQPTFLQYEVYPEKDGRAFHLLACIENGWGDCGNINIFVHLDENRMPDAACYEASCC